MMNIGYRSNQPGKTGKRVTISESEIKKKSITSVGNKNIVDVDLLEYYLGGQTIQELAQKRCLSRQNVESLIKTTALSLKSSVGIYLKTADVNNMLDNVDVWTKAIEFYRLEQVRQDKNSMHFYVTNWASALVKNELETLINGLIKIYEEKYGSTL